MSGSLKIVNPKRLGIVASVRWHKRDVRRLINPDVDERASRRVDRIAGFPKHF
jgi:hypothetical protein